MLRSIRARTLVLVLGVLSLSMTLISYKSYRDANHEIKELFDAQLAQSARLLQGLLGRDIPTETQQLLQAALDEAFVGQRKALGADNLRAGHPYESKMAFQLLDNRGQLLLQSASAPNELLAQLLVALPSAAASPSAIAALPERLAGYHDVPVGAYHWRIFVLHDVPDQRWILVGEREDVRGELVGLIARRIMLPQLLGLPILALLIWLAIGWGLAPLAQMASFIKSRAPDNLAPLLLAPLPRELEPIIGRRRVMAGIWPLPRELEPIIGRRRVMAGIWPLPRELEPIIGRRRVMAGIWPLPRELEPMVAALNRLLQQIAQLLAREQRFLADAAHELRTPLAVLRIHAQNAQQAPDPVDRASALLQLGKGVERATRVVTQLLTLARLEPAAVQLSMGVLDFAVLLRQELAELTPLALDRQQELELQTAGDNFQLVADGPSLGTLLQNLVGNALQYTPNGGRIRVSLEAQLDALWLRVQDSGPGVAAELRGKLFERFFRQGMGQGAGLGLSIAQRVVELHGGSIELRDSPFAGLEVLVRLPRQA